MESLAHVIERAQSLSTKPVLETLKAQNPEWVKAKMLVDSFPADFDKVLRENLMLVKKSKSGKYNRLEKSMGLCQGYPTVLIVYEPADDKGNLQAFYAAYNRGENLAYRRDII